MLSFLNNYMWGELSKLPVLGTALEALGKTIAEANQEMSALHKKVREEMEQTVGKDIKQLSSRNSFPFLTYDQDGHTLSSANPPLLPGTRA